MKSLFAVALGILTAIGGFLDIGDLVTNAVVGARFGLSLAWVVPVGVLGICVFAQMSGRVAAVSGRATFEIIRERLGPRTAVANLCASFLINLLTLTAEVGGIALALQLASSVNPKLWIPVAALAVWLVIWRVKFSVMENVTGVVGLCLVMFAVAVFLLGPDWGQLANQVFTPSLADGENLAAYWYYAIALFGAAMTPYEVFYFSSGAVEEKRTVRDLAKSRLNVLVGFPLGGILSVAIAALSAIVLMPGGVEVSSLSQVLISGGEGGRKTGGRGDHPRDRGGHVRGGARNRTVRWLHPGPVPGVVVGHVPTAGGGGTIPPDHAGVADRRRRCADDGSGPDPGHRILGGVLRNCPALTYLPVLIISNDPQYMGEHVNGPVVNAIGTVYLVIIVAASAAAIPLMIVTGAGQ